MTAMILIAIWIALLCVAVPQRLRLKQLEESLRWQR